MERSTPAPASALITLTNLGFAWPGQAGLSDISSSHLKRGEGLFLKGPSGSGKTALLGLLGGVRKPGRGNIRLLDEDLERLSAARRDHLRVDHTGYIFQQSNLLSFLLVCENVELPCRFPVLHRQHTRERHGSPAQAANHLFGQLGLGGELHVRCTDSLLIGQQQRVVVARALISQPELAIADRPTSALDADSREAFLRLLFAECHEVGVSLLFVSHDQSPAGPFDHSLPLSDLNRTTRPAGL